ncbi:hypothetical protein MWU49_04115 [Alcanivorax sp. S6407]|uniref:hypothetical protein n=1 Tax=Alcanivorax sp. S6407 TaxID=2926424 RepID=UPI001FF6376B|nr:hypothetical protein [Alcanivorax sp. S6407]MCK0152876.1 hypothetical protein [Alcanivorax sp. S6407]
MFRRCAILASATSLALLGCKSDIPELNITNSAGSTLSISRSFINTEGPVDGVAYACINAPTAWGGPTGASVKGTLSSESFTSTPGQNAGRSTYMEDIFPRDGYSWYCHDEPDRDYQPGDQGEITWQFAGQNDSALVFTIVSGSDENPGLTRFAAHQVNTAGSTAPFYWEPLNLSGAGPEFGDITAGPNAFNDGLAFYNDDDGHFYLRTADGTLTTAEPDLLSSAPVIRNDRLVGLGFTENGLQAQVSTDGQAWQLSEVIDTGDGGLNLHENPVTGDYVASLGGNLYTSADALAWSAGTDTGLTFVQHYAVLPDGTQIAASDGQVSSEVAEGNWSPVLAMPEGSSANVFQLQTAGNAVYLLREETVDGPAPTTHLYRSEDGQAWTELLPGSQPGYNLALFAEGERILMLVKDGPYVSNDGGVNWAPLSVLPEAFEDQIFEWYPVLAGQQDGIYFLSLSVRIGDSFGSSVALFLASEDLETFQLLAGKPQRGGDFGQHASVSSAGIVTVGVDSNGTHMHRLRAGSASGDGSAATASVSSGGGGSLGIWLFALLLLARRNIQPSRNG